MKRLKRTLTEIAMMAVSLPAVAQTGAALPDGAGKETVQKMCVGCHALSTVTAKRATPEQWANIVQQMVSRGADGTDAEIDAVTKYLSTNFAPADSGKPSAPATPPPTTPPGVELSARTRALLHSRMPTSASATSMVRWAIGSSGE